jgi:2-C-methyl-D-erythritol 4-phosphate cytidylyltransferase
VSEQVGAIVVAAGAARRMGFDKLWTELAGKLVLTYALDQLVASGLVSTLALVVAADRLVQARQLAAGLGARTIVCVGGASRRESVAAGLAVLPACRWVLVHDAARPFLTPDLIARGLETARETGAAVAAVPARDTLKRVVGGTVVETPPRAQFWQVQTPQIFRRELLTAALERPDDDVTDEATLVERLGGQVRIFDGADTNWKITTPADLRLAEALLAVRSGG